MTTQSANLGFGINTGCRLALVDCRRNSRLNRLRRCTIYLIKPTKFLERKLVACRLEVRSRLSEEVYEVADGDDAEGDGTKKPD